MSLTSVYRLEPHENPTTDVVLLGHSMGGLLAAEVALMPPRDPNTGAAFRHRILGTISFDTPFLGMHPGLVVSGIGSLFRPAPPPPGSMQATQISTPTVTGTVSPDTASITSPSLTPGSLRTESSATDYASLTPSISNASSAHEITANDPYYNPPFHNDVHLQERTGWNKLLHFVNKHADGLTSATTQYFMSHIEFGGCLADFPGLKNRYRRVRGLEDVDDTTEEALASGTRRIRFVNYYTASTGLPKKPKPQPIQKQDKDGMASPLEDVMNTLSLKGSEKAKTGSQAPTPRISLEEHSETGVIPKPIDEPANGSAAELKDVQDQMQTPEPASGVQEIDDHEAQPMQHIDSIPIQSDDDDDYSDDADFHDAHEHAPLSDPPETTAATPSEPPKPPADPALPPIPPLPTEPEPLDLTLYSAKDSRKLAEKEHKRLWKTYQQALKNRESALKDRRKLLEKREKKAAQEREKALKAEEKQRLREEKEAAATVTVTADSPHPDTEEGEGGGRPQERGGKPRKERRFCLLPGDLDRGAAGDRCWVRVYMEGVDEVGAHCGLFFPGPQYEGLVGDAGERVVEWVREDATRRMIEGLRLGG